MKLAPWLLLLLAACGAPPRPAGDVHQPGEALLSTEGELLEERWHSVRLDGSKLGHVHEVRRRVGGLLRTESLSQIWNQAEAPRPTFVDHFLYEETPEGRPVRYTVRSRSPFGDVDVEAKVEGGEPDLLFPNALEARFRQGGDVTYRAIDASGTPTRVTARAEPPDGELLRYSVTMESLPHARITEWRDREGRVVRSEADLGIRISQERSTREEAIWLETRYLVPRGRLGDARRVRRGLYRITVKEGEVDPSAFAFDGQTVEKVEGRQVTLRVEPFRPEAPSDVRGAPLEEDAAIAAAAREAVGEETNAWKAARAIERWVHRKIRYAPSVLLTAREVLEKGEGDCTEYALLAAAMARAAGLEARVSHGLTAAGRIFGEHAWTEVRVGRWAGIDATMGGPLFDATHIRTDVNIKHLEIEVLEADDRIRAALYDDAGASKGAVENLERALEGEAVVERVKAAAIRAGALARFDVLLMPGGSASKQAEALGPDGRSRVREFVSEGGGYAGFCAGAYLASSHYPWSLAILDAKVIDTRHWNRGEGPVKVRLSPEGMSLLGSKERAPDIQYVNGPLLGPGGRPDLSDFTTLATFEGEIAKNGAPTGVMPGTVAAARGDFGSGRVLCFSPHPEKTPGLSSFVVRSVQWAAGRKD